MVLYNLTQIGHNTSGLLSLMQSVNNVLLFGWLGILLLIAVFAITFMAFITTTNDVRKSLSGSSFICFGMALFLKAMGLIPDLAMFISLLLCAGVIAFSFIGDN